MEPVIIIGGAGFDAAHLILFLLALALAGTAWWLASKSGAKEERLTEKLAQIQGELIEVKERERTLQAVAEDAKLKLAAAEARSEDDERKFADIARTALRTAQSDFMTQADQRFEKLVEPVGKTFAKFEAKVEELGKDRAALRQKLDSTDSLLKENRDATSKLITALSSPKGGGQWGRSH